MTAEELAEALGAEVVQDGAGPVRSLGLALDAVPPGFGGDGLLLHRWWGLELPEGVAVLGLHDGFDGRMVPWMCEALGVRVARPVADKTVVGSWRGGDLLAALEGLVGGVEEVRGRSAPGDPLLVAVAGRLDADVVAAVTLAGASVLVTGQWRPAAAEAVEGTGLAVVCVGHRRWEEWGLRELAGRINGALPDVAATVCDASVI